MALVQIDQWLAERGITPPAPDPAPLEGTPGESPEATQLEALHAQIAYQADLIARLQAALSSVLDELRKRDATPVHGVRPVARRPRPARAAKAPPLPTPPPPLERK